MKFLTITQGTAQGDCVGEYDDNITNEQILDNVNASILTNTNDYCLEFTEGCKAKLISENVIKIIGQFDNVEMLITQVKEKTKVLNVSLTQTEINLLEVLSKQILGVENKSGLIRYWINQFKLPSD